MDLAFASNGDYSRCDYLGTRNTLLAVVIYYCIIFLRSWTLGVVFGHLSHILYYLLLVAVVVFAMACCALED